MDKQNPKPPRRVRYKGTHPKSFHEKYKELQPDKYVADVEKIVLKGNTPAGMHRSICVKEIMDFLNIKPGQRGLDATLGYGGHSTEILKYLLPGGKLYAIDVDPVELPRTRCRLLELGHGPDVLDIRKLNFANADQITEESGPFDFILADLGVSSMQIDNPERGFSLKHDGPLDLRLNPQSGYPASKLLKNISQQELETILVNNADEPYADILAEAIVVQVKSGIAIENTSQLKDVIKNTLDFLPPNERLETVRKTCQRCFQALRIEVNDEFAVLEKFLSKLPDILVSGGRVAILSFHSGEDRRVKKAFQLFFREGIFNSVTHNPIRPSALEIGGNPRARSAKLRWAVKA